MTTLIIGASTSPEKYSFKAANSLLKHGHKIKLIGTRAGEIQGNNILAEPTYLADIETVTLYINPKIQASYYDYILTLKPQRVIFNPGTENPIFEDLLEKNGIEPIEACTLVMLSIGTY